MTKEEYEEEKKFVLSELNDERLANRRDRVQSYNYIKELIVPFHDDKEVMLACLQHYPGQTEHASERLYADRTFVESVVSEMGSHLALATDELKDDIALVAKACEETFFAIQHASHRIKSTPELVAQCCDHSYSPLNYLDESVRNSKEKYVELMECLTKRFPKRSMVVALSFASEQIQKVVGDGDPIPTLKSAVLSEKLETQLRAKPERTKTLKI